MEKCIILMADVVNSGKQNPLLLQSSLKNLVFEMNDIYSERILSPLTITLGDEFQAVILDLKSCLSIVLYIEEYIKREKYTFTLRYVIHEGIIQTKINTKVAYEMLGEGLTNARNTLISLKKNKATRLKIEINDEKIGYVLGILLHQILHQFDKWSVKDYSILVQYYSILKTGQIVEDGIYVDKYKEIAKNMNKNPSLIWRRVRSLGLENIENLKKAIYFLV
ncbi:MAG: SatD family protein [Cytophagales bacterium]